MVSFFGHKIGQYSDPVNCIFGIGHIRIFSYKPFLQYERLPPMDWTHSIPALDQLDQTTRDQLQSLSRPMIVPAGTRIFSEGMSCQTYLILLSGQVRVQKVGENGREIVLYRVGPGQTCIVTTACLMCGIDYDAEGIAETELHVQALPLSGFRQLLASSAMFREFVFKAYGTRITDLLVLIEDVAFGRIDQRLAACLMEKGKEGGLILATHQELSVELGTVREVISRQLKDFEHRGWVRLNRGSVQIVQQALLNALAQK